MCRRTTCSTSRAGRGVSGPRTSDRSAESGPVRCGAARTRDGDGARMFLRHRLALAAMAMTVGMVGPTSADQIIAGADNYRRGEVVGFADGEVRFRTPDLVTHRIAVLAIDQMVVDSVPGLKDLTAAEENLADGKPDQAAVRYDRVLRVATDFWPDLIRVRRLVARDRAGEFEGAAQDYIYVAEVLPRVAAAVTLRSLPSTGGGGTRRVLARIDEAVQRHPQSETAVVLQLLRFTICVRVDSAEADRMAPEIAALELPAGLRDDLTEAYALRIDALDRLLRQRRYADVVAIVNAALADAPDGMLPDLLLCKGKAIFASASERSDQADYIRAGWAFMRVAIHFPDDSRAGEALFRAAQVHEQIGRPSKAVQLLRECLGRSDVPDATRADAQAMLTRLTTEATTGEKSGNPATGG